VAADPDQTVAGDGSGPWLLVRRISAGQAGYAGLVDLLRHQTGASGPVTHSTAADVYVLADPAGGPDSEPAAAVLVVHDRGHAVEIGVSPGLKGDLLARLLVPVTNALRAQGVRLATWQQGAMAVEGVAAGMSAAGFVPRGGSFELEL
jgi:hypothetical protein